MTTFEIHQGDSLSFIRERVASNSIDCICTDPPYSSLEKHRKTGTTTRLKKSKSSSNVWFQTLSNEVLLEHAREWLRVLKPGRHFYMFCDPETSYDLVPGLKAMGWVWGNRLIWSKLWIGMGYHYRRSYEDILFFTKKPVGEEKKRKLADLGMADLLNKPEYRGLKGGDYYPTEKPVPVIKAVLGQSTFPGELVMDPFLGSGSTGEAALSLGCRFIGIDSGIDSIVRSTERLAKLRPVGADDLLRSRTPEELARLTVPTNEQIDAALAQGARERDLARTALAPPPWKLRA